MYTRSPKSLTLEKQRDELLLDLKEVIHLFNSFLKLSDQDKTGDVRSQIYQINDKVKLFIDTEIDKKAVGYPVSIDCLSKIDEFINEYERPPNYLGEKLRLRVKIVSNVNLISLHLNNLVGDLATKYDLEFNKQLLQQNVQITSARSPKALNVEYQYQLLQPDLEKAIAIFSTALTSKIEISAENSTFLRTLLAKIDVYASLIIGGFERNSQKEIAEGIKQFKELIDKQFKELIDKGFDKFKTDEEKEKILKNIYAVSAIVAEAAANKATEYDLEFKNQLAKINIDTKLISVRESSKAPVVSSPTMFRKT
ncbi:MAG: hypothetical protein ACD_46C00177G0006 [uncultured bacterium]|nr:MAG: hypothetical protein ACD_46C00177G0006 [uncultured bacterium]